MRYDVLLSGLERLSPSVQEGKEVGITVVDNYAIFIGF